MEDKVYDVVIVGGGPAGLTAALYCCRDNMSTLLFEPMLMGGMVNEATLIENYPGFPNGINGYELSATLLEHAKKFGMKEEIAAVTSIKKDGDIFEISSTAGNFKSRAVIVAAGSNKVKLGIPGEKELAGKGVSYCATCDGPFFRDCSVAVIGGGNTALAEADHLTKFASKVYLIHRRNEFRATSIVTDRVKANEKIEIVTPYKSVSIEGKDQVEKLVLENAADGNRKELAVDAVFVAVGIRPNTDFLKDLLPLEEDGTIRTDTNMATSVPGLFAAGDIRFGSIRQVISAAGDGATSAIAVKNYLS